MFGKFFASAFTGSMMAAGPEVFAVWGYVIAHTVDSAVELNPRLLAAVIGSDESRMQAAINQLCSPDPRSRSKNDDGCRLIKEGEYQYRVPNHEKYRSIRDEDGRREYNRLKQQEHRAKVAMSNGASMTVNESQACQPKQKQKQKQKQEEINTPRKRGAAARLVSVSDLVCDGVEQQAAEDWLTNRKAKDLPLTPTAWKQIKEEAVKAGLTPAQAVSVAAGNGWAGFKASWSQPVSSDKFAGAR